MNIWHTPEREQLERRCARSPGEGATARGEWERTGELPRELHRKAGEPGLLGAGLPEAVGGGAATARTR